MSRFRAFTQSIRVSLVALTVAGSCRSAEDEKNAPGSPGGEPEVQRAQPVDPGSFEVHSSDLGLSPYEPVYFSLGFNEVLNARFQISLKFRPLGPTDDTIGGRFPWNDLYLAYTQTSVWDLESESKPFYDTSYRPGIFYQRRDIGELFGGRLSFRGGFEHESNGKGGDDSRSINTLFVRPSWWWTLNSRWALAFSPKVYTYIEDSENTDIADYRGYVDWQVTLAHAKDLRLTATARYGTEGKGSLLVDASYPFNEVKLLRFLGLQHGYLHIQYFNGYGETILSYDEKLAWQLRVGLMLVR